MSLTDKWRKYHIVNTNLIYYELVVDISNFYVSSVKVGNVQAGSHIVLAEVQVSESILLSK